MAIHVTDNSYDDAVPCVYVCVLQWNIVADIVLH